MVVLPCILVSQLLKQPHDSTSDGHLEVQKPLIKIQRWFSWVGQRQEEEDWCHHCKAYVARKALVPGHVAPMQSSASGTPFQQWTLLVLFTD